VKVRNNSRRGLLVRVPGQGLHLQPGEVAEVPRAYLKTEELSALLRAGTVLVVSPPTDAPPPPQAGPSEPAPAPAEPAAHKPPRLHKRPTT
jgi:hypothetical protein